jgi:hypothetical protein
VPDTAAGGRGIGRPWLALCLALAIHIADEAFNGFLPAYNDAVQAISELFPFVPAPRLTLAVWLGLTVALVAGLTALLPFAYRGAPWMRTATIGVSLIALANVSGHAGGSLMAGHLMPGVYSTPILAVAGLYALIRAWRWNPEGSDERGA